MRHINLLGAGMALFVERPTEKPDAILTRFDSPVRQAIFLPGSAFSADCVSGRCCPLINFLQRIPMEETTTQTNRNKRQNRKIFFLNKTKNKTKQKIILGRNHEHYIFIETCSSSSCNGSIQKQRSSLLKNPPV